MQYHSALGSLQQHASFFMRGTQSGGVVFAPPCLSDVCLIGSRATNTAYLMGLSGLRTLVNLACTVHPDSGHLYRERNCSNVYFSGAGNSVSLVLTCMSGHLHSHSHATPLQIVCEKRSIALAALLAEVVRGYVPQVFDRSPDAESGRQLIQATRKPPFFHTHARRPPFASGSPCHGIGYTACGVAKLVNDFSWRGNCPWF